MVKITEDNDAEKLLTDSIDLSYDYFVKRTNYNRVIFPEVLLILVNYFYAKCKEDIFQRSGFLDTINGSLKKNYDALSNFKSASIRAVANFKFVEVKSKSLLLADYLDSHKDNIHAARRIYETALSNSSYIFPLYKSNSFYNENIGFVYDVVNDNVKYRVRSDSRYLSQIIFDADASSVAKDVLAQTIKDNVVVHLINQLKKGGDFYDCNILKNNFSCFKSL